MVAVNQDHKTAQATHGTNPSLVHLSTCIKTLYSTTYQPVTLSIHSTYTTSPLYHIMDCCSAFSCIVCSHHTCLAASSTPVLSVVVSRIDSNVQCKLPIHQPLPSLHSPSCIPLLHSIALCMWLTSFTSQHCCCCRVNCTIMYLTTLQHSTVQYSTVRHCTILLCRIERWVIEIKNNDTPSSYSVLPLDTITQYT